MPKIRGGVPGKMTVDAIAAAGVAQKNDLADLRKIDIAHIVDMGNVRESYEDIEELADSIMEHGLLQPISVKALDPDPNGFPRYELVAGFRRWKAYQLLNAQGKGFALIDAILVTGDKLILQLIENLQRTDLTSKERERGIALMAETGIQQNEIARLLSKGEAYISKHLAAYEIRKTVEASGINAAGIETSTMYVLHKVEKDKLPEAVQWVINNGGTRAAAVQFISPIHVQEKSVAEAAADIYDEVKTDEKAYTMHTGSSFISEQSYNGEEDIEEEIREKPPVEKKSDSLPEQKSEKYQTEFQEFPEKLVNMSDVGKTILEYIDHIQEEGKPEAVYCVKAAHEIIALLHKNLCDYGAA